MDSQATTKPPRITSIDAYRGLVMFLMVAAGMALYKVADDPRVYQEFSDGPEWARQAWNASWKAIGFHTNHVKWSGASLHDMIQPSFSFLVGVALPFSLASRQAKGQGFWKMFFHAV